MPYERALELQKEAVAARRRDEIPDTLFLLEHPPVITAGRGAHDENLLRSAEELERAGVELHEAGRGGDVTFHGPGQLVGYPIVALEPERHDAHRYLRDLEEALIRTVRRHGVVATREEGLTGIWVGRDKLGAIGVRLNRGWITSHGFALNVADRLEGFSHIVPCGIGDRGVTSLERLTGRCPSLVVVAHEAAEELATVLGRQVAAAEER